MSTLRGRKSRACRIAGLWRINAGERFSDPRTHVLPFGPLGNLVHPFLVKPQLRKIFAYREKVVRELFGRSFKP